MAEIGYLTSAVATGALLLAVWLLVSRMENWRSYDPTVTRPDGGGFEWLDSTGAWMAGFFLLVLVVGGGAVALVSSPGLASAVGSWVALAAAFGVLLLGFVLWGTYSSVRHRGHHSATAAMVSAWVFGGLFVTAIAVKLLLAG
jgi:hypothetical protein